MKRTKFCEDDYVNKKFGYLTILKFTKVTRGKNGWIMDRHCLCKCNCGGEREYVFANIKAGLSKSCGCKPFDCRGVSKSPLYSIWYGMVSRCHNKKDIGYKNYGGRGITVCRRWHNVENFIKDIPKILGDKPSNDYSLDRPNNDRGYSPDNVRWATKKIQNNNKRYSKMLTAGRLAEATGYSRERVRQLTYRTTSDLSDNGFPLKDYILEKISTEVNTHYFYKPEAINYLLQRRK